MLIPFVKMHAQGNDFVILNLLKDTGSFAYVASECYYAVRNGAFQSSDKGVATEYYDKLAVDICTPHTGIGADGLVIVLPSKTADAKMIIFNSDGSRAEMCGSALRCISNMLSTQLASKTLQIETDSGIKTASISPQGSVSVNIGIPLMRQSAFQALGFTGDLVDVGNLHYVVWHNDLEDDPHLLYGATLEHYKGFPKPVNVHFSQLVNPQEIHIKIWEHACGATLACGTGAVSCVFSGIQSEKLQAPVKVVMPGGAVVVQASDSGYLLGGEVSQVFCGEYLWKT